MLVTHRDSKGCFTLSHSLVEWPSATCSRVTFRQRPPFQEEGKIKLAYSLPDEIVEKATRCTHSKEGTGSLPCQENPAMCCRALGSVGESFVFIDGEPDKTCNYFFHYASGGCCNCPVRVQLWKNYRV